MAELKPQVPGETNAKPDADPVETKPEKDETVTVSKSLLESMQQQLEELSARVAAGPRPAQKSNDADLPHPDTIDTALIKSPVLSRHGWVVPDKFGSNAAQPKG